MKKRGLSLIETLVVVALLGTMMFLVFNFWDSSARTFFYSTAREDIASEARRAIVSITSTLQKTDGEMLVQRNNRFYNSPTGANLRRDAICFVGISDWKAPTAVNRDEATLQWNLYYTVYATLAPQGKLVVATNQPPTPPYKASWPGGVQDSLLQDNPALNGAQSTRILSESVDSLIFRYDLENNVMLVDLTLAKQGSKKTESRNVDERSQVQFRVRLENTSK